MVSLIRKRRLVRDGILSDLARDRRGLVVGEDLVVVGRLAVDRLAEEIRLVGEGTLLEGTLFKPCLKMGICGSVV